MNAKNSALLIISVVVCVVILASTMLPAIQTSTEKTARIGNTGSYFAAVDSSGTIHTINIAAGQGSFVITTDGKKDITPSMGTYNPGGQYVTNAIAIGVYEAYNDDGVLKSIAGVTPTGGIAIDTYRTYALAGNDKNTIGTYQLWNYYQYTLDKLMALTVIGNTDSQYMMGPGKSASGGSDLETGLTSSAYTKSATNDDSVSIFIENDYGSKWELVGDTVFYNYVMSAGNTLGGKSVNSTIDNKLTSTITMPDSLNGAYINGIYLGSDSIGVPNSYSDTIGTSGQSINDATWTNSNYRLLSVGGGFDGDKDGIFAFGANTTRNNTNTIFGSRLAYVLTDYEPTTTNYGYIITFGTNGNTITNVQALVDGVLTDTNPTGTTLNSYWDFDTNTGIGPFGAYYVAINLADVDTESDTDYLAETMLGTKKGQVAYILNPSDWTETLAGTSYTSGNYNVMLVVPTVYWGVSEQKLYMTNDPTTFANVEGLELQPYAHTYTVDPSVDTGNPVTTASATVVYGDEYIVRLYSTGDVYLITTNNMVNLGQVSGENTVTITVTDDVLGYTPAGGSAATVDGVLAYIASSGEYVQCKNPYYSTSQTGAKFIIGGYANNLATTTEDVVDIGYCTTVTASDLSIGAITVLDPVSDASNTVSTNGAVWQESTLIESDLYKVGDLKITTTWSDTGTSTATYNYYLAPAVVEYNNPAYVDNPMWGTLIVLVGTLCLIGVVLGAVRIIGGRE